MSVDDDVKMCASGPKRAAWLEVDLEAIRKNFQAIRELVGPRVQIMVVVKANGYGHGIIPIAKTVVCCGADQLGVALLQEALELRKAGIACPILILGCSLPDMAHDIVYHDLIQTVSTVDMAKALSDVACLLGKKAYVHIKVDSGMGRLGVGKEEIIQFVKALQLLPNVVIAGIFTHFACANENEDPFSEIQLGRFRAGIAPFNRDVGIVHAANSAALVRYPFTHLDMVRAGMALYGLPPFAGASRIISLCPSLSLRARIVQVRSFQRDSLIGYHPAYRLPNDTVLAVVPVGYVDGLPTALSKGYVLIKGKQVPIVGQISMDQFTIDVGHIPKVEHGDIVTIIGRSEDSFLSVQDMEAITGVTQSEIVSSLTERLPRIYINE